MSDIPSFLNYLFGQRAGWACLGWLDGDPRLGDIDAKHQEWFELPQNRETMERRAEWHAAQGHNLYVRQVLFCKRSGYQTNALPSPILWQDEATIDTPASMLIETSPGNYQAFSRLDRPASTTERKAMMTAWRDARPGTDNCSKDPVHFVRVPGGINRKGPAGNGTWRVRYAMQSERTYTADRLLARCGARDGGDTPHMSAARGSHSKADDWRGLVDGELLYTSKRWQAIISHRPQLNQLLNLRQRVIITNKNGRADDSDSAQRAVFVQNIITASPYKRVEHIPEDEMRAVAHYLKPVLGSGKTEREYQADIDWMIGLYRPKNYTPKPTRYTGAARDVIKKPVGRPTHAPEVKRFYLFLQERIVSDTPIARAALAGEYGIDTRTVATYLKELKDAGKIAWERKSHGLAITFGPRDVIEIQPAVTPEMPIAAPEIKQSAPVHEETEIRGVCVSSRSRENDHISQAAHSDESPTLADLAKHYLDQPASVVGEQVVNKKTGAIHCRTPRVVPASGDTDADALWERVYQRAAVPAGDAAALEGIAALVSAAEYPATDAGVELRLEPIYRRTAKHFAALVTAEYPYTTEQAIEAYKAEQQRRKDEAAREWALFFARLRTMTDDELIAYVGGGCRREIAALACGGSTFDKHLYATRLKCAKQRLGWRGLTMPKRATKAQAAADEARVDAQADWAAAVVRPAPVRPFVRFAVEDLPASLPSVVDMGEMVARLKTSQVQR